jgi:nucleotide-binding universal stress UspA family protein
MSLWTHIAVCVDDSPGSSAALDEARRLRDAGADRLSLVHVAYGTPGAPSPEVERARDWLDETARTVDGGEPVLLVNLGRAAGAVSSWAWERDIDLLVASAHRGLRERAMLGSFASYLAHHSPCAVLLVRPPREAPPAGGA